MKILTPLYVTLALTWPAMAQDARGPVVQPDVGWVSTVWAGPHCDFFEMIPSHQVWAIERGKEWTAGINQAATQNKADWQFYEIAKALGQTPAPPTVVVSASTSPAPPGSQHPPYSAVPVYAYSQVICGGAGITYPTYPSAIAILPAGPGYGQ